MAWTLANPFGIQVEDSEHDGVREPAWHAGSINDILSIAPGHILVASETGGVWYIDGGYNATPLGSDWRYPDVECLASGPGGPQHVFAGCLGGLYEAVISPQKPLATWKVVNLPAPVSNVYRIVATQEPPRVAIATNAGIWWADAKPPPGGYPSGSYVWQAAKNIPQQEFSGLALSPDGVIAGVRHLEGPALRRGIYYGAWSDGLTMHRAGLNVPARVIRDMRAISIASCRDQRMRAYALGAGPEGKILRILRSDDGGRSWEPCSKTLEGNHNASWDVTSFCGDRDSGGWHKTISVHHHDPDVVGFGGLRSVLSTNGGRSWRGLGGDFTNPDRWDYDNQHQHDDVHAFHFEPGFSEKRLYIASDGGVVLSEDWSARPIRFKSAMNRNLANLQFYSAMEVREFWGTIGSSGRKPLIGGGLQDNGNVWCQLRPYPEFWRKINGGDGGWVAFILTGIPRVAFHTGFDELISNTMGESVGHAVWHAPRFSPAGRIPLRPPVVVQGQTIEAEGLKGPVAEPVPNPKWKVAPRNLMQAVAAVGRLTPSKPNDDGIDNHTVFGLFGTENEDVLYWSSIGELPKNAKRITALGTDTGYSVYAGTADGRIFLIDAPSGQVTEMGVTPPSGGLGAVVRIAVYQGGQFAVMRNGSRSHLMTLDGGWREINSTRPLPAEIYYGFDVYTGGGPVSMAVATNTAVWVSADDGDTWFRSVSGLPTVPHCTDLRFGKLEDADMLFLGTWGRSVWMIGVEDLWESRERPSLGLRHRKFLPFSVRRARQRPAADTARRKKRKPGETKGKPKRRR